MSDYLVYLARTSRFGERNGSRKLAMIALCNAASDDGDAIVMGAEEIAEAAELVDVKSAMRVRRELIATGLVEVVVEDGAMPGQGRGVKGTYRINVARLRALHDGAWSYLDDVARVRAERAEKGGARPPQTISTAPVDEERVASHHPIREPEKGGPLGGLKGGPLGGASPTSSIKDNTYYSIDDVPGLQIPGWSVAEVQQLEPDRWPVLLEAFLRWDGARKAVDIGKAFIGWSKSVLKISKPGKDKIASRADWGMIYAMAGISAEEARQGVALPSGASLAARAGGDWRGRLRATPDATVPLAEVAGGAP